VSEQVLVYPPPKKEKKKKRKGKKKKEVKKEQPEVAIEVGRAKKGKIIFVTEDGRTIMANIRMETEKSEPLVKVKSIVEKDGKIIEVFGRFIGPKKRFAYVDKDGNEYDKKEVKFVQELSTGELKEVKPFKMTREIKTIPVESEVLEHFKPSSFVEIWGETPEDEDALRKIAFELKTKGKIGFVKKFSWGRGFKAYVGFIRPIIQGNYFILEMVLSEGKHKRRRWMPTEPRERGITEEPEIEIDLGELLGSPKIPSEKMKVV